MDKVCVKYYADKIWICGETYENYYGMIQKNQQKKK